MESEEEEELEEVNAPLDNHEIQNVFRLLTAKLEDMQTCCDLINKHGSTLQVRTSRNYKQTSCLLHMTKLANN